MHLRIFCDMTNLQYICFLATAFNYRTYTILIRYFNICFFKIRHYFFFKSYILFLSLSIQTWKFLQHRCPVGLGTSSRTLKLSSELWSLARFLCSIIFISSVCVHCLFFNVLASASSCRVFQC